MCDAIAEYHNDEDVSVAILDGAALAVARGHAAPVFISSLILPSHLLRIARDYYDADKRSLCIEFCQRAWASKSRLPYEAQLEILRLWGLSTVRINSTEGYRTVLDLFQTYGGKTAERIRLFVEGFYFRVNKRPDLAESKFLDALRLSPNNQHINRELANLLAKQRRYAEAERFARQAYEQAPTNPFLIDVMVEVLIGKRQQGLYVDNNELQHVKRDLERYGDAPGSSFYLVRKAQSELADRNYADGLNAIDLAIQRTPGLLNAHFIRAEIKLALGDLQGADQVVGDIKNLLTKAGGISEGDEARLEELEINILIEKRLLRQAKAKVDRSTWLSQQLSTRLLTQVARAVAFEPSAVDASLRQWAVDYTGKLGKH